MVKKWKSDSESASNRNSYANYRMVPFSMTLNDPKPRFQTYAIILR